MSIQRHWEQIFGSSLPSGSSLEEMREGAEPHLRRLVRRALRTTDSSLAVDRYIRDIASSGPIASENDSQTLQRVCDVIWDDLTRGTRPQVRQATLVAAPITSDTIRTVRA